MSFRKVIQDPVIDDKGMTPSVSDGVLPLDEPQKPVLPSLFEKGTEPHKDWVCSITCKLMADPVVAEDGYSYERTAIETWFKSHSTSPMIGSNIDNKSLYPNIGLKGVIQEWKRNNIELVKEDEQLDRQLDMNALRMKPAAATHPIVRQSSFIPHIGTITLPGWNTVQNMLSRDSSQNFTPRYSPRINQLMRVGIVVP